MSGKLEDSYDKFIWFLHQSCLFSFVALLLIVGFVMFSSCVAFDHPSGDQYGLSESLSGDRLNNGTVSFLWNGAERFWAERIIGEISLHHHGVYGSCI